MINALCSSQTNHQEVHVPLNTSSMDVCENWFMSEQLLSTVVNVGERDTLAVSSFTSSCQISAHYTGVFFTGTSPPAACWADSSQFSILWRGVISSLIRRLALTWKASLQVRKLSVKYSTSQHIVRFGGVLAHSRDFPLSLLQSMFYLVLPRHF